MVATRRAAAAAADSDDKDMAADTARAAWPPATAPTATRPARRTPAWLPTPLERAAVGLFPLLLVFGSLYSALSPQTRAAPYDAATQSHAQDPAAAPSYFARKSNLFNLAFVKRGWGWTTLAFALFALGHPSVAPAPRRLRAGLRWALVTAWWLLVTQWCFGAPLIDRGFRWTGGRCDVAERAVEAGGARAGDVVTAAACKAAGGRWRGGHDVSGHVFLLVLGTLFLMHEVGWPLLRWQGGRAAEQRSVLMRDGALKGAAVDADADADAPAAATGRMEPGLGGKMAAAVAGLNLWMLLMTAIYFHTWFEKLTGLLMALAGVYAVYHVPRLVPALRAVVGLPGI